MCSLTFTGNGCSLSTRKVLYKQNTPEPIAVKTNRRSVRKPRRFSWGFQRRDGNAAIVNSAHAAVRARRITALALAIYITSTSSHTYGKACHASVSLMLHCIMHFHMQRHLSRCAGVGRRFLQELMSHVQTKQAMCLPPLLLHWLHAESCAAQGHKSCNRIRCCIPCSPNTCCFNRKVHGCFSSCTVTTPVWDVRSFEEC